MNVRLFPLMLIALSCGHLSSSSASDLPPFEVQIPKPKELFRIEDLTDEQARLCAEFRRLAGQFRKPVLDSLLASGAFPLDEKRITVDQIVALLGDPESRRSDEVSYSLGSDGSGWRSFFIKIIDGRAALIGFTRTL